MAQQNEKACIEACPHCWGNIFGCAVHECSMKIRIFSRKLYDKLNYKDEFRLLHANLMRSWRFYEWHKKQAMQIKRKWMPPLKRFECLLLLLMTNIRFCSHRCVAIWWITELFSSFESTPEWYLILFSSFIQTKIFTLTNIIDCFRWINSFHLHQMFT